MNFKRINKKNIELSILETNNIISNNFIKLIDQKKTISSAVVTIINSLKKNKKIFFCGNGGSAADSLHLTAELVGYYLNRKRKSINAISLNANVSSITAIANDSSFDKIFVRQLEGLGVKGDVLFAITTSGKSKNVLNALDFAKKNKLKTILLTSEKYKNNKIKVNHLIKVPSTRVDRIQEMHIAVGHIVCELLEKNLK